MRKSLHDLFESAYSSRRTRVVFSATCCGAGSRGALRAARGIALAFALASPQLDLTRSVIASKSVPPLIGASCGDVLPELVRACNVERTAAVPGPCYAPVCAASRRTLSQDVAVRAVFRALLHFAVSPALVSSGGARAGGLLGAALLATLAIACLFFV